MRVKGCGLDWRCYLDT